MGFKQIKYIQLDDQAGKLYAAERQSLLVPIDFVRTFSDIFEKLVGKDNSRILISKIGQGLGQAYAQSLETILIKEGTEISKETKVRIAIDAIFMESGWGRATIKKLDLEKGIFQIVISNTPSQSILKYGRIDLEEGVLIGIVKEVSGHDVHCTSKADKKTKDGEGMELHVAYDKENLLRKKEEMTLLSRQELENKIKKATSEISEEKEKLSSIITSLVDGLIMVDSKGVIQVVNPQAERYMKLKHDDLFGKQLKDTSLCGCFNKLYDNIKKSAKKKIVIHEMSTACSPNDEKASHFSITGKSVLDADGEMIGCLLVIHDVTRDKIIEQLKSEFISIAAHQLRTPLSGVKWALKMILEGEMGEVSEEVKTYLDRTYKTNDRMIRLVNDLLNVTRIEEGRFVYKPTKINIENILDYLMANKTEDAQKRNIKVTLLKSQKAYPFIKADEEKIQIAIGNILDNAIKYSKDGGEVRINLSLINKDEKEFIHIEICDQGIGIKEGEINRLFTKYYRAENAVISQTEGSGLGLFIVKNIIEAHGGEVRCNPKDKTVTCFEIDLPVINNKKKYDK